MSTELLHKNLFDDPTNDEIIDALLGRNKSIIIDRVKYSIDNDPDNDDIDRDQLVNIKLELENTKTTIQQLRDIVEELRQSSIKIDLSDVNSSLTELERRISTQDRLIQALSEFNEGLVLPPTYDDSELREQISEVSEDVKNNYVKKVDLPQQPDLSMYALKSEIPSGSSSVDFSELYEKIRGYKISDLKISDSVTNYLKSNLRVNLLVDGVYPILEIVSTDGGSIFEEFVLQTIDMGHYNTIATWLNIGVDATSYPTLSPTNAPLPRQVKITEKLYYINHQFWNEGEPYEHNGERFSSMFQVNEELMPTLRAKLRNINKVLVNITGTVVSSKQLDEMSV